MDRISFTRDLKKKYEGRTIILARKHVLGLFLSPPEIAVLFQIVSCPHPSCRWTGWLLGKNVGHVDRDVC